jgi:hypothetical protein
MKFKVGNLYTIEVMDHSNMDDEDEGSHDLTDDQPHMIRWRGACLSDSENHVVIEYSYDIHNREFSAFKAVKRCITKRIDHGPSA